MLKIHILNVGHGDSAIIEYHGQEGKVFGVIDSNNSGDREPAVLRKLKELGAEKLSFISITHPHADHYAGMSQVLEFYRGKIDKFYTFPLLHPSPDRVKKLATIYREKMNETESPTITGHLKEFVKILFEAKTGIGQDNWENQDGLCSVITPPGFNGVDIAVILPPKAAKGAYFQMIESGSTDKFDKYLENEISLAFLIEYAGQKVVLGGDGTLSNWLYHKKNFHKVIKAKAVKLPHHGSKTDSGPQVIDYLFPLEGDEVAGGQRAGVQEVSAPEPGRLAENEKVAFISANGYSHPHPDVYAYLKSKGIKPYCTNLAKGCGATIRELVKTTGVDPTLGRYLNLFLDEGSARMAQPCQGNITLKIHPDGKRCIDTQFDRPCIYRGDFDHILQFLK